MHIAIIAYDLRNVSDGDNVRVKEALLTRYSNTISQFEGKNDRSLVAEWVTLKLPDTTLIAYCETNSSRQVCDEVAATIRSVGAVPDKIFVAFLQPGSDYVLNAPPERNPYLAALAR